jgi:CRP/FNR family transcriptional regulator, dissimilatory nitrate respiration regulator
MQILPLRIEACHRARGLAMIAIMSDLIEALSRLPNQAVTVAAGETLFRIGEAVRFVYLVRSGAIHLTRFDAQGGAAVMQRALADTLLAESSVFSEVYHCDAVAVADASLVRISRADLRAAAEADPRLMEGLARHLAREVQRMRIRLEVRSMKTVRQRLDAWLALGDGRWPEHGTMAGVAQDIGVSPEAFYREMQRRRRSGAAEPTG